MKNQRINLQMKKRPHLPELGGGAWGGAGCGGNSKNPYQSNPVIDSSRQKFRGAEVETEREPENIELSVRPREHRK